MGYGMARCDMVEGAPRVCLWFVDLLFSLILIQNEKKITNHSLGFPYIKRGARVSTPLRHVSTHALQRPFERVRMLRVGQLRGALLCTQAHKGGLGRPGRRLSRLYDFNSRAPHRRHQAPAIGKNLSPSLIHFLLTEHFLGGLGRRDLIIKGHGTTKGAWGNNETKSFKGALVWHA